MRHLKPTEERIALQHPDRQTVEIRIRGALVNYFNALGTAETDQVA